MDRLFAPWRMTYILGDEERPQGCIFCTHPVSPAGDHRTLRVLAVREHAFVMMNRFPYANGHLLVSPRRHVAALDALPADEQAALSELLAASVAAVRSAIEPDGFNVGMNLGRTAGAGIADHLHWHVVPRWEGDHNFMPVLGETRVINEHLDSTFDRLLPHFGGLS